MSAHLTDLLHTALGASLNGGYQGMVVAGVVLLGLRFFPGINAATRYLVGFGVLLLVVLLPVLHFVVALPDLTAGNSEVVGDESLTYEVEAGMEPGGGFGVVESGESQGGFGLAWGGGGAGLEPELLNLGVLESEGAGEPGEMAPAGWVGLGRRLEWSSTLSPWVGLVFFLTWLGVALIRVIRLCRDYRMLMVLKRRARPVSPEVEASFDLDDSVWPRGRAVAFRLSDEVMIPLAAGFRNPVILFPEGFLDEVKAASVRQVARHEMAHLCRGDDWTNLLQQILKAVFFFLPAVWWVSRRLDMDREIACDDHVLAVTDRLQSYALTLTELAGRGVSSRSVPAPAAWTNKSQLKERIEMILNKRRNASTRTGLVRAGVLTMTTLLLTVAALQLGPRIAFGQDAGEEVGEEVKTIEREVKLLGDREEGVDGPVPDRAKKTEERKRVVVRTGAEPNATDAPVPARRRGISSAEGRAVERVRETRERRRPGVGSGADVFDGGDGRSSTRRGEVGRILPSENVGRSKGDDAMEDRMARLERLVETLVARQGPGPGPGQGQGQRGGGGGYGGGGAEGGGGGFGRGGAGGGGAGGGGGGFGRGGGGAGGSGIGGAADFAAQPSLPRRSTRAGAGGRGGVSPGRDLNPGVAARGIGSASPAYGPGSGEHRPARELRARRDALRAQVAAMNAELKAVERRLHELEFGQNHPDDSTAPRNPFQR